MSNVEIYEGGYNYLDIVFELSTIASESIIIIYGKTFIKINDLAYFSRLKKYSKF